MRVIHERDQVHFANKSQDNQVNSFTHWAWRNGSEWTDMWETDKKIQATELNFSHRNRARENVVL